MKYLAYSGTPYEYRTVIPNRKKFSGKKYELAEVFPNYGSFKGHHSASNYAQLMRDDNLLARVDSHSGYTAVYVRVKK